MTVDDIMSCNRQGRYRANEGRRKHRSPIRNSRCARSLVLQADGVKQGGLPENTRPVGPARMLAARGRHRRVTSHSLVMGGWGVLARSAGAGGYGD
jgi:hypothetical protein